MWERLVRTQEEGPGAIPTLGGLWWETATPLAIDHDLAAEKYHMLISTYYQRTTWKERLFNRIAFGYRGMQREEAEEQAREKQEADARQREQMAIYRQGRP